MASPNIELALWLVQPILLSALVAVMYRRRLHKEFPAFFAFAIAQVLIFLVEFPIYLLAEYHVYFIIYWVETTVTLAFDFKIIHEIFIDIFRPYHALKDLGTALFKWAALIMVLVSAVLISSNPTWHDPVGHSILALQRCVGVIQCGLVLFLLAFCKYLNVSWKRQSFGIAWGFGISAAVDLVTRALFSGSHVSNGLADLFRTSAFDMALCVWLAYSILNRRELAVPVLIPQRWDNALMDLQPYNEPESLIPMFEHMVDRAFSRTADRHA
ncbi:MAG TPA: hypothetical protein VJO35_08630 [Terriglobales bacterium]|nr:hypothetical protein [Terriglobales bacterium]